MKVKDLLNREIDIDVVDNVCAELYIAFCGPIELTEDGVKEFTDALDLDIIVTEDVLAVVDIDKTGDDWKKYLTAAERLFRSAAGYCSVSNYNKWFK